MAEHASIFVASDDPLTLAVLVLSHASILKVALTLDPMRNANRQAGREAFARRAMSSDGAAVPLTCALSLPSSVGIDSARGADVLAVVAGCRRAEGGTKPQMAASRRMAPGFRAIFGIDAGPWVLVRAA